MRRKVHRKGRPRRSHIAKRTNFFYGWVRDLPDHRDFHYVPHRKHLRAPPSRVDLRKNCPPIYNQGKLNSCTANAIAAAVQFDRMKQSRPGVFRPSRLFIYYNARAIERSIDYDNGAQIRNGIKSVAKRGVCHERLWPYRIRKFRQKPSGKCYVEAAKQPALIYHRVDRTVAHMKACLASGYPFVVGLSVFESFESKKVRGSGHVPMPVLYEQSRGGHAVLAVGYEDTQQRFIVRNSWGRKWGMCGYFTLPYDYLANHNLSQDLWTIRVAN